MRQCYVILIGVVIFVQCCGAQVKSRTKGGTFTRPVLSVTAAFEMPSGPHVLQAGESAGLLLKVTNSGEGIARGVVATLNPQEHYRGIVYDSLIRFGEVPGHGEATARVAIAATSRAGSQSVRLNVEVHDSLCYSVASTVVMFSTKEPLAPRLKIAEEWIRRQKESLLRPIAGETRVGRGDTLTALVRVQNIGKGSARGLQASVTMQGTGQQPSPAGRPLLLAMKDLPPDSSDMLSFPIIVPEHYAGETVVILLHVGERRAQFSLDQRITLSVSPSGADFEETVGSLLRQGSNDSAMALCLATIAKTSRPAIPYFYLGSAYMAKGNHEKGVQYYQKSAQLGYAPAQEWLDKHTKSETVTTVSYRRIDHNPFSAYPFPIGLGILMFSTPRGDAALTEMVLDTLRSRSEVLEKFTLFPYSSLNEQKKSLGIDKLDPTDKQVLEKLDKNMDIKFVVYGVAIDEDLSRFTLEVVRTSDGNKVFSQQFQKSRNSTPLNDAVMVFAAFVQPVYKTHELLEFRH